MAKLAAAFDYTDAELLALWREALAKCSQGQSYQLGGKSWTSADLPHIQSQIAWLEQRIAAANPNNSGPFIQVRMQRST